MTLSIDPRIALAAQWLNLVELRRAQFDLSLESLAERAGISAQTLTNLRKGGLPQQRTLAALQEALDLPSDVELARERIHQADLNQARANVRKETWDALGPAGAEAHQIAVEAIAALAEARMREYPEHRYAILRELIGSAEPGSLDQTLSWLRDMSSPAEPSNP